MKRQTDKYMKILESKMKETRNPRGLNRSSIDNYRAVNSYIFYRLLQPKKHCFQKFNSFLKSKDLESVNTLIAEHFSRIQTFGTNLIHNRVISPQNRTSKNQMQNGELIKHITCQVKTHKVLLCNCIRISQQTHKHFLFLFLFFSHKCTPFFQTKINKKN